MKNFFLFCIFLLLFGCKSVFIQIPDNFVYKEIKTSKFTLASWQKITDPKASFRIYIEGDGHAFYANGLPTNDPTPHSNLLRDISFNDPAPNVIYLARPCQYVMNQSCDMKYWTTARFSQDVVDAEYIAVKNITNSYNINKNKNKEITLIGFSGGAQIVGLITVQHPELNIKKVITIAGNLGHKIWSDYLHLNPLIDSLDLADYIDTFLKIDQIHFVGQKDKIILPKITQQIVPPNKIIIIKKASHNKGWKDIYPLIYQE